MSVRAGKRMALAGVDLANKSDKELQKLFKQTLDHGMHGLCFSPYEEGQSAGDQISEQQIRLRMEIIKPYTKWIRTFSCTDGNEFIPKIAHEKNSVIDVNYLSQLSSECYPTLYNHAKMNQHRMFWTA